MLFKDSGKIADIIVILSGQRSYADGAVIVTPDVLDAAR